ncbi:MAG TPA: 23S rRNA (adenine(2503)-C(2))-methyltransferase RlmN [Candidatus Limenecus avicola]|jgi:23S rRNA m2A2503 methyltransferase|uniref:Probable dual-specificity RNA methyltransferase RlmN n=1 Tax=Candidatus Limenecus avicola TaxID=2840847 RepID=A0A9D1N020_9CLOT|nr:23S rRNA (adenine(2503)-C(2))-methyltransferase RlmN [Candidatus Limenecus avicola]
MSLEQLTEFTDSIEESKYRAKQLHNWIYLKSASTFEQMSDISKKTREKMAEIAEITNVKIKHKQVSVDGTIKYLLEYPDGNCVETVLMRFDNRANLTACVSSQVGCACNCKFCATAKLGFIRNLTPVEIIEQVLTIQRDTGLKVTNIVFMGQGEPLLNLDNVLKAIDIFNKDFVIGIRRLTVSTCGIIPQINKLAALDFQPTLAISLHAPNHALRSELMPIENKYNLDELMKALKDYVGETGRRITIEYTLIKGFNDTTECAKELAKLLIGLKANINLIIYNPNDKDTFEKPTKESIQKFKYILEQSGKKVTIRLERGSDIDAACGQLSNKMKD